MFIFPVALPLLVLELICIAQRLIEGINLQSLQ